MKINIVYIQKKKVWVVRIKVGKKTAAIKKSINYSLEEKNLDEIFAVVAKSLGKNIRILLSPSLFSVYTFTLPLKTEDLKNTVSEKIASLAGEQKTDLFWDYKEISQTATAKIIQAVVLQKDLLDKIITTGEKYGLTIDALEPVAYSLASLTPDPKVHLLLYPQGKKVLALVLEKRKVLTSLLIDKPEKIEILLAFVKDKFKLEVSKVILSEDVAAPFKAFCNQKAMEIQSQNFNPVFGLALENESLLSILPKKEVVMSEGFAPRTEEVVKPAKKGKKIFLLFFLALGILATVFGVSRLFLSPPQPSPSPSPTPGPVEEVIVEPELDRADLKLQVLNGSGEKGVAGTAQEYLEGLGYQDIDAGNAEKFDYEETQIEIKAAKEEYLPILQEDLEAEYTLAAETATLDEDSDFDAIIIVGKE